MKTRKWISFLISLAMVLAMLPYGTCAVLADGSGTEEDPYLITGETSEFVDGGYYLVAYNVTNNNRIQVKGSAVLILGEDATLRAPKGIEVTDANASLTIRGTGTLVAKAEEENAAIGGSRAKDSRSITIEGGTIDATGGSRSAGIGGGCYSNSRGTIKITGGTVTATGGWHAAGIGGGCNSGWRGEYASCDSVVITGGTVTAKGGNSAPGIGGGIASSDGASAGNCGSVTITGGTVSATGGTGCSIGIGPGHNTAYPDYNGHAGTITLGLSNLNDSITVSGYEGTVTIEEGIVLDDGSETFSGVLTDEQVESLAGKILRLGEMRYRVLIDPDNVNGSVIADKDNVSAGETVSLTVVPDTNYVLKTLSVFCDETEVDTTSDEDDTYTFTMPQGDVIVSASFVPQDGIYLVGPDWSIDAVDASNRFSEDPENESEYLLDITLSEGDQIRVVKIVSGEIDSWYPALSDDQYTVDHEHEGAAKVHFSETYNSEWAEYGGYFWLEEKDSYPVHIVITGGNGVTTVDKESAYPNARVTVSVSPAQGFLFSGISVTGSSGVIETTAGENNTYSFIMPHNEVTVYVSYALSTNAADHTLYAYYTCMSGTSGVKNQGPEKLVDNNINTKWCIAGFSSAQITFYVQEAIIPLGYILTTGEDTATYTGRNPTSWTIEGKLDQDDDWTTLATVVNNNSLPSENSVDTVFAMDTFMKCKYFRFSITSIKSGDVFQLSEFRFFGEKELVMPVTQREATCVSMGYARDCWYDMTTDGYYADQACTQVLERSDVEIPATGVHSLVEHPEVEPGVSGAGHIHYWTCANCGRYFSDSTGTNEISPEDIYVYGYVGYLDANGEMKSSGEYTLVTSDTIEWTTGWWVVARDVTIDERVVVNGDVNLILCDGATLFVDKGITVNKTNSLTIYSQSLGKQMGKLTTGRNIPQYSAGIGGPYRSSSDERAGGNGPITINGGVITAYGGYEGAGIGSGYNTYGCHLITINNGIVTATGGEGAAGIGSGYLPSTNRELGEVEIHGGTVTATSPSGGAGIGGGEYGYVGRITITGGNVTAYGASKAAAIGGGDSHSFTGGYGGDIYISGGNVTAIAGSDGTGIGNAPNLSDLDVACSVKLSWTKSTDSIYSTSYQADSVSFEKDFLIQGTEIPELATSNNINGKTIVPFDGQKYQVTFLLSQGGPDEFARGYAIAGGTVENPEIPLRMNYLFDGWYYEDGEEVVEFVCGQTVVNADITVFAKWTSTIGQTVYYLDADGNTCSIDRDYTVLESSRSGIVLAEGWYVVTHDITLNGRTTISGDVHLILGNDTTVYAHKGIQVSPDNSLTIYQYASQTDGETIGKLIADEVEPHMAGIGGFNSDYIFDGGHAGIITINGGMITASAGINSAAIGGGTYGNGTVVINRGIVDATGDSGAAIGGGSNGSGTVTINGGTVTAKAGYNSAAIGGGRQGDGTVIITGGTVKATGKESAGIGGGSWAGANVTITGGNITAVGQKGGAGIGSSLTQVSNQKLVDITITGGTINATGGDYAAGIGGGAYGNVNSIIITGGVVIANGGDYATAIGGGSAKYYYSSVRESNGYVESLIISGGQIRANAGADGTGMGTSPDCTVSSNISIGYTKRTDSIYASSYKGSVSVFDSLTLTDGTNRYTGKLTERQLSSAGMKTLVPVIPDPSFKSVSLLLSGQIGVNFVVDLPLADIVDYSESYMTFEISGKGSVSSDPVPFDPNKTNDTGEYYCFTCYVNSIQMADTITATLHYGDGETISLTYSIRQYVESFDEIQSQFDDTTVALVHALADYGHYVQLFLAATRGLALGDGEDQYAEMYMTYTDHYNISEVKSAVAEFAAVQENNSADIMSMTYSLLVDTDMSINVYFKPVAGYNGIFEVEVNGEEYTATKLKDGRYLVKISGISAHRLGEFYQIDVRTASGEASLQVSALSYVNSVLNYYTSESESDVSARNAAAAIYYYYNAAIAYKSAHSN